MEFKELDSINELFKLLEWDRIIAFLVGLFVISLIVKGVNKVTEKTQESFPSKRLLALQIATVLNFSLYIFGSTALIYISFKPPKELLLALGGSAAVAIGFALKDLVSSIVAGFILLFDRPFQVGDRVTYADTYGEILGIGLRTVRLVTLDDNLVTIPNSKFLTDSVASGNAGALDMMVVVDFRLSLDADLRKAQDLLNEVVSTSRYIYLKKPISIVLNERSEGDFFWIELKVKAYVFDVRYEKAFQTDIVLRGNEILKAHEVKRPVRVVSLNQPASVQQ